MAKIFCKVMKHFKIGGRKLHYFFEHYFQRILFNLHWDNIIIFSHYFLGNIFNYFEKIKMFILLKNLFQADGFLTEDNDKKSLKKPFLL